MNFIEYIRNKSFLRHLLLSFALTAIIIITVIFLLKGYTHHGESYTVPSLVGLTPDQIEELLTIDNFEILIIDSVFDARQAKGTVLIQDPVPGSNVKKNRKIYLTTVAVLPEQVKMPNLVDLTLRQAKATIETYGLRLGQVQYVPDIAANAVLEQSYKGAIIIPGRELLKGSIIDLKVGEEVGKGQYEVPFLLGKTRAEATALLNKYYFVIGDEIFEDDANAETARVYLQTPDYSKNKYFNAGQPFNLVYRDPITFDFEQYLESLETPTDNNSEQEENLF